MIVPPVRPVFEVVIETPRFGVVKRKANGQIDFISPVPCPFNYGRVDGTVSGDGDPLDAIVLGARLTVGTRTSAEHRATVHFVDDGQDDPKLVLSGAPITGVQRAQLRTFFLVYAVLKRALNLARGRRGATYVASYEFLPG
ncbi:MAG: inorganic diphosphatase [Deltaproteobacteria bacterium]|nr:inorganic diphosphatase [Deltaproteobacteria bacterium]